MNSVCVWRISVEAMLRLLVMLIVLISATDCYLFSLLLSNPVVHQKQPSEQTEDLVPDLSPGSHLDSNEVFSASTHRSGSHVTIREEYPERKPPVRKQRRRGHRKRGDRDTSSVDSEDSTWRLEKHTDSDLSLQLTIEVSSENGCDLDVDCPRGRYCHQNRCTRKNRVGDSCSRDAACRGRMRCVLGTCSRVPHRKHPELKKCETSDDCAENQCCARQGNALVCKKLTPVGEHCINQPAHLSVPIYDICPCQTGSRCRYIHREGETWSLWKAYNNLRCVASD